MDLFINGHEHDYERNWPTYKGMAQQSDSAPNATICAPYAPIRAAPLSPALRRVAYQACGVWAPERKQEEIVQTRKRICFPFLSPS